VSVFTNPAASAPGQAEAYVAALLGLLGDRDAMRVLRDMPAALHQAVEGLSDGQAGRPEAPGKWSIREVAAHLADSDLVWGYRLRMVLSHDRPAITGYDQDLWASRLRYAGTDLRESLERFAVLRRSNLRLLEGASAEDLLRVGVHAERGEESVAHLIRLYAGHDLLHLAQIERIRVGIR
jgi:uncharacterized damage-inducible protein DinB